MVRKKNVLATMAQSLASARACARCCGLSIGYSLAFTGDGPALGTLERVFLRGIGMDAMSPLRQDHPGICCS